MVQLRPPRILYIQVEVLIILCFSNTRIKLHLHLSLVLFCKYYRIVLYSLLYLSEDVFQSFLAMICLCLHYLAIESTIYEHTLNRRNNKDLFFSPDNNHLDSSIQISQNSINLESFQNLYYSSKHRIAWLLDVI